MGRFFLRNLSVWVVGLVICTGSLRAASETLTFKQKVKLALYVAQFAERGRNKLSLHELATHNAQFVSTLTAKSKRLEQENKKLRSALIGAQKIENNPITRRAKFAMGYVATKGAGFMLPRGKKESWPWRCALLAADFALSDVIAPYLRGQIKWDSRRVVYDKKTIKELFKSS